MYVTVADCVYVGRKWQKWNICTLLIYSFVIFLNALNFLANFICVILDEFGDVAGVCVCVWIPGASSLYYLPVRLCSYYVLSVVALNLNIASDGAYFMDVHMP